MTLAALGEDKIVAALTAHLPAGRKVICGPGDDCAVIRTAERGVFQLLKTDCLVEDVHFRRTCPPHKIGWKALCRNLSDIAAMGGRPDCAIVTIAAPADLDFSFLSGIYDGLRRAALRYSVSIVGGETSRSNAGLFISVALTGFVAASSLVLRSGGRPGDILFVTGRLGGSIRGRHLTFTPRLDEAAWLVEHFRPRAMIDLSDGLAADLPRLAASSRCGYRIDLEAVPRSPRATTAGALGDGEDYELLFAMAPRHVAKLIARWRRAFPRLPLTRIGELAPNGMRQPSLDGGYRHFSGCQPPRKSGS